jgi:hypothetical protein
MGWLRRHLGMTLEAGPDGAVGLGRLEQHAGQMTSWYDQRGVRDPNPPTQPEVGYANAELKLVDPNWEPM